MKIQWIREEKEKPQLNGYLVARGETPEGVYGLLSTGLFWRWYFKPKNKFVDPILSHGRVYNTMDDAMASAQVHQNTGGLVICRIGNEDNFWEYLNLNTNKLYLLLINPRQVNMLEGLMNWGMSRERLSFWFAERKNERLSRLALVALNWYAENSPTSLEKPISACMAEDEEEARLGLLGL